MTDTSGTTKYEYLNNGRLLKKITPQQGTLTYTYDENGNVTSVQSSNPNGLYLIYTWDPLNRLSAVTDNRTTGVD